MDLSMKISSSLKNRALVASLVGIATVGCQHTDTPSIKSSKPTAEVASAVKKGGEATRRNVKVGLDADASKIDLTAKDTTIEDIVAHKAPADGKITGRVAPFETSTWRVKAQLTSVKLMKDGDYYLTMKGENGGQTVVEVPDPKDCKGSPLEAQITATRKELEERYHPTTDVKEIHDSATVTGVGFLGFGNSKKNSKSKVGARLMPGLGIEFDKKSEPASKP